MYMVYLSQDDHTIELQLDTYDQVLTLFNFLRSTKQNVYFQCYDPIGKGLIHRTVMLES